MGLTFRAYTGEDLPELMEIWNDILEDGVASCLYTQIPESRINTELFNYHQKTE